MSQVPTGTAYGSPTDWANIISGAGQGANSAMQSTATNAGSRYEAREAKRRTLANMLNSALKRQAGMQRARQEYSGDINDYQAQAMQNMARGFIESLQGSTQ
jgi:hypothetical protein